jgi:hypothetical protein
VSFGDRAEWFAQAHLAILTALAWSPPPCEVIVATDRPDWYWWFGDRVGFLYLAPATIEEWSGEQRFVWRIVLKAMVETAFRGPEAADFLYLDVDTLVRRPLDDLLATLDRGDVFLDRLESPLARRGGRHRALWNQVRGRTFEGFRVDRTTQMWNSGVVAVGARHRHLLEQSLRLCDAMTAAGVQSGLVEQIAQSIVLQSTGRLRESRAWIDHYWGNKAGFNASVREQLVTLLMRRMSIADAMEYVRAYPIHCQLRIKPRWWHRHLRRFAGVNG